MRVEQVLDASLEGGMLMATARDSRTATKGWPVA
jgi:hypothetical protein